MGSVNQVTLDKLPGDLVKRTPTASEVFSYLRPRESVPAELGQLTERQLEMAPVYRALGDARDTFEQFAHAPGWSPEGDADEVGPSPEGALGKEFGHVGAGLDGASCLAPTGGYGSLASSLRVTLLCTLVCVSTAGLFACDSADPPACVERFNELEEGDARDQLKVSLAAVVDELFPLEESAQGPGDDSGTTSVTLRVERFGSLVEVVSTNNAVDSDWPYDCTDYVEAQADVSVATSDGALGESASGTIRVYELNHALELRLEVPLPLTGTLDLMDAAESANLYLFAEEGEPSTGRLDVTYSSSDASKPGATGATAVLLRWGS